MSSGIPELFDAGAHGSAGSPDIIEENISGSWVYGVTLVKLVGGGGLSDAGLAVGANLDGAFGAVEKLFDMVITATEFGEMLGDEMSVVEATSADVLGNGGERNDGDVAIDFW